MNVKDLLAGCDINKLCDMTIQKMNYEKIISSYKRTHNVDGLSEKDICTLAVNKKKEVIKSCVSEMIKIGYMDDHDQCVGVTKYMDDVDGTDEEPFNVFSFSYREFEESGVEHAREVTDISEMGVLPITTYSFIYTDWKDVLGYRVTNAAIQMYGMERVAAEIFWEMTWCGFDYETCEKNQNRDLDYLDEVKEEAEVTYSIDAVDDEELKDLLYFSKDDSELINSFSEAEVENIIFNRNESVRFWKSVRKCENEK